METLALLGTTMGLGFVAGINLYAMVLAVGLGVQLGLIQLPPHLAGLAVLGHPFVVVVAGLLYTVEFFADKIPWVDSAWDVVHTFIRPLGAAIVAVAAVGHVDPGLELAAVLLGSGVALSTHLSKAGLRLLVNASPEPASNVGVSLAEDVLVLAGSWLAVTHPVMAGAMAALFVVAFLSVAPRVFRLARVGVLALGGLARSWLAPRREAGSLVDEMPAGFADLLPAHFGAPGDFAVRCVSGRGLRARAHRVGFLCLTRGELLFVTRQRLRVRGYPIDLAAVDEIAIRRGLLLDRVTLRSRLAQAHLYFFFKDAGSRLDELVRRLERGRALAVVGAPLDPA